MKKSILSVVFFGAVFLGSIQDSKFTVSPQSASACDYCLLTQGLSPLVTTHGFGFRLDGRYTVLNSMFSETSKVENHDNEEEKHFTTQLTTFYNMSEGFTVIGILPLSRRSISLNTGDAHGHDEDTHGDVEAGHSEGLIHSHNAPGSSFSVGDLSIMGRYTFFSRHNFQQSTLLAVQAGIKLPTGATKELDDAGEFLDAHIQPGTGSLNFLAGLSFNFTKDKFGLSSNLLYSINTTGNAGDDDYRFGNWLNADITTKYPIITGNQNLFVSLGLNGEIRAKEEINGIDIGNTGGEVLYIAPGLQLMLSRHFIVEASFLYPFYHNLNGAEQLGEDYKSFLGINYVLN